MKTTLQVQERLTALGYYKGKLDGIRGPKTDYAILQWQRANDLVADGIIGPKSEAKLFPPPKVGKLPTMTTSAAGRAAITEREGNKLTAYRDSVGILTIGVGHTSAAGPPAVAPGMTITATESDQILSRDLAKFELAVLKAVKVPMSQSEFDALVSLAFNIGGEAFVQSTLVKKLNSGDRMAAADQFMVWNKAGGNPLKGLTARRQAERRQFLDA